MDFLRFNLQFTDKYQIQEVAEYLSKEYSYNSVFIDQKKTYSLIKKNPLNWKRIDFDNTNLGRINLCYDRKLKESDRGEGFEEFIRDVRR